MRKYDYVDRVLYMAMLSQECTAGNGRVASGIWELTKRLLEKKKAAGKPCAANR